MSTARANAIFAPDQHTRPPKYGNHRVQHDTVGHGVHWHDSDAELRHCDELTIRMRAKDIASFIVHPRFTLHGQDGSAICDFIPDFHIVEYDGTHYCEDVKGYVRKQDPSWRIFDMKCKMLLAEYGIPVRVVQ